MTGDRALHRAPDEGPGGVRPAHRPGRREESITNDAENVIADLVRDGALADGKKCAAEARAELAAKKKGKKAPKKKAGRAGKPPSRKGAADV